MLLIPIFQCIFVLLTALNSSYFSLLLWGSSAQLMPHVALAFRQAPLLLAVLGPPYLPAQTLLKRADMFHVAVCNHVAVCKPLSFVLCSCGSLLCVSFLLSIST